MPRYSLASMANRARSTRRKEVVLRKIVPPSTLASDLYNEAYAPVIQIWQASLSPIMAQYQRTLAMMTDSPEQIGSVLTGAENELGQLFVTIRLRLERWALRAERWQRGKWRGAVLTATGVDLNTMLGAGDMRTTLATVIERNTGLIRSVSEQARTRIGDAVFKGLQARTPAREVAKEIREAVAMSRSRALRIASDQNTKLASQLNEERALEAGLKEYAWVHSGKMHPREEHKARNGKRFKYGEPAGDAPGFKPFCGCTARAVLSLEGEF